MLSFGKIKEGWVFVALPGLCCQDIRPSEEYRKLGKDREHCRGKSPEELTDGKLTGQQV